MSDVGGEPAWRDPGPAPDGDVYDWYIRGVRLLAGGDPAAAAMLLTRAADAEPSSRNVREALARALFDSKQYAEAAENFAVIVAASPSDDYARYGLGLSLARVGEFKAAVEHLALAAAMRPDTPHYQSALRSTRATLRAREGLA